MDSQQLERLAKIEMATHHHDKRLTILEDEKREWDERIRSLSTATERLVVMSENLLHSSKSHEHKIGLLEQAKNTLIGWFAGAAVVVSAVWAMASKWF